ncbi:phage tail tip fiber protein [Pseudomonas aeruginosa]|jgi:hypothetical protein|uniref:phage tail tip fiber protein n=2 Tax=Pseudomonas aeruginosa TaxID=287 RepID=UPI0003163F70|nr:DUF1983 domain-containing protein [Pseudomonas aeruginosa]EIU3316469.1 DUF1983 domain-containing protein [Pseudomonas aeruginosa]EIY2512140.1 DUF1983 domain-containing protein [Pseudomonas aeruginosa]EIY2820312.1 DUF1983 domain-containing protein [Pseudomonas aeruginosa]EKT8668870.1 DUF1983 domain-containing protein [Pseudomonas aeruginosa]EKU2957363.1 DUF1983 domain-containing protein [Pseudomonas aeruginosa]
MTVKRSSLPTPGSQVPAQLRPFFSALTEIIETGEGNRGDRLDKKVTYRDLLESGAFQLRPGWRPGTGGGLTPKPGIPDLAIPPKPVGFGAAGVFGMITLTWDNPYKLYRNHSLTNIYRSEVDNFGEATLISRATGMIYSDPMRQDAVDPNDPSKAIGYYYWITWVSNAGIEGPPNSPNGTYAESLLDIEYIIGLITNEINEGELAKALVKAMDLEGLQQQLAALDAAAKAAKLLTSAERYLRDDENVNIRREISDLRVQTGDDITAAITQLQEVITSDQQAIAHQIDLMQASIGQNAADIVSERTARITFTEVGTRALTSMSSRLETAESVLTQFTETVSTALETQARNMEALVSRMDTTAAQYLEDQQTIASEFEATANAITTLQSNVNDQSAAIQQTLSTHTTALEGLAAQYTLRLDVNGLISGFGAYNDGTTADFAVLANRFWIATPGAQAANYLHPFIVENDKVYINTLMVKEASIQQGQIGPISIGKLYANDGVTPITTIGGQIRAEAIDVANITIGFGQVYGQLTSSQVGAGGLPRFVIDPNGGIFMNGLVGGTRMVMTDSYQRWYDPAGTLRIEIGELLL